MTVGPSTPGTVCFSSFDLDGLYSRIEGIVGQERCFSMRNARLLESLERFDAPYLEEKLLQRQVFESAAAYREAFVEFKKFILLKILTDVPISMVSRKVDEVWHQFILFTREYHEFCNSVAGDYLHHSPNTSFTRMSPDSRLNFVIAYRQLFGQLHPIWLERSADISATGHQGSGD